MRVSILMPVFNGEKYVDRAIESVLTQTHTDIELCVVDDGSIDGTWQTLSKYKGDARVKMRTGLNGGIVSALNRAYEMATGEVFAFLAHDDVYLPTSVEVRLHLMATTHCKAAAHGLMMTDAVLNPTQLMTNRRMEFPRDMVSLVRENGLSGGAMMLHRDVISDLMPFPTDLPFEDWWLALGALFRCGRVVTTDEPLILYRQHDSNDSGYGTLTDQFEKFLKTWKRHVRAYRVFEREAERLVGGRGDLERFKRAVVNNRKLIENAIDGRLTPPSRGLLDDVGVEHYRIVSSLVLHHEHPRAWPAFRRARSTLVSLFTSRES